MRAEAILRKMQLLNVGVVEFRISLVNQHPLENRGSGVEPILKLFYCSQRHHDLSTHVHHICEYDYKTFMNMIIMISVLRNWKMHVEKAAEAAAEAAAKRLGYEALKPKQVEVVKANSQGRDVFAVLPTGFGKSLCYSCLPWVFDELRAEEGSIVIVVTPLTAIMIDQASTFFKTE